jgi:hypothetical protein
MPCTFDWPLATGHGYRLSSPPFSNPAGHYELGLVVPGFFLSLLAVPLCLVAAILSRPTRREVGGQLLVFLLGIAALYCAVWALSLTFYTQWLGD